MTYITEAHNRLLAHLAKNPPTEFSVNPSADEFICQRAHVERVASLVDDYLHALAIDAASNSHEINSADFVGVVSSAVHDASLIAQFTDAAHAIDDMDHDAERADHHHKLAREVA